MEKDKKFNTSLCKKKEEKVEEVAVTNPETEPVANC